MGRHCWDTEWLLPAGQIPHSWGSAPKGLGLRCCCLEGTWFLGQHSPPCVPGRALMQGDVSMVQGRALGCDRAWQAVPQGALQGNHCLSITTEHVWVLPRTGHPQPHGGQPPARLTLWVLPSHSSPMSPRMWGTHPNIPSCWPPWRFSSCGNASFSSLTMESCHQSCV